ncbi:MAG TPA: glycoside hydrolase family 97 N-terminal domain-containing protein, partial [Polyangia bacterium]
LYFRATVGGGDARVEMLPWSPLGITRKDADFTDDLRFLGSSQGQVTDAYTMPRGKRGPTSNTGVEEVLSFRTPQGARMDLIVRAYDDGFAFRYHFPETAPGRFGVIREATGFAFAAGSHATLMPVYEPGANQTSEWLTGLRVGTAAPTGAWWALPGLIASADGAHWALLTESGLNAGSAALGLAGKSVGAIYRVRFPHPDEEAGQGEVQPSFSLPWSTPWRMVILSDHLAGIVESTLATDLAPPAAPGNWDWVRPGNVAGHLGEAGLVGPMSFDGAVAQAELAVAMGWGYARLPGGWPAQSGGRWRPLVEETASHKVGLLVGPKDAAALSLADLASAGLKGVRVAVSNSGKPEVIASLLALLEEAGQRRLMVEFEGRIPGAGWDRTYPHLLSATTWRSGTGESDGAWRARQNLFECFTRNVLSPMQPMPIAFNHRARKSPMTFGHILGLTVVFESGLRSFVDATLPKAAVELLSGLPSAWDETRLLDGDPGHVVILARRKGRTWYVAGLNGDSVAQKRNVAMDLVGTGLSNMVLLADGPSPTELLVTERDRNATDVQAIKMMPYGGFLMRLSPLR